jgi:hypothetical protein
MKANPVRSMIVVMALCLVAGPVAADDVTFGAADLMFGVSQDGWRLTVSGPEGVYFEKTFKPGVAPTFSAADLEGKILPDGTYNFELRQQPDLSPEIRSAMFAARAAGDDTAIAKLQAEGKIPYMVTLKSGSFSVAKGMIRNQMLNEATKDVLHYDDVIITGSLCIGFDCANGESFGYATLKLKENNLQLLFEDTSIGTFPTNDWKFQINDTTSGGASYFTLWDVDGGRRVFTVEAGAPTHSLYVEDYGRVGLGTSIPYVELHMVDGDSPTIRLDQDGSSGWVAQRWDMCGNETNFFIRDVTNGSKLCFRIQPNTPSNTLSLRSTGYVGVGTWSPAAKLHVAKYDGVEPTLNDSTVILAQNNSSTTAGSIVTILAGTSGNSQIFFGDNDDEDRGRFTYAHGSDTMRFYTAGSERIRIDSSGRVGFNTTTLSYPFTVGDDGANGNGAHVTNGGTWTNGSSREFKQDIRSLEAAEAMSALAGLEPVQFRYIREPDEEYVGFIAEDVPDLVATSSRKYLSPMDIVAVLTKVVQEQQSTIEELQERIAVLEDK